MRTLKKTLAFALAALLSLSLLPAAALAAEFGDTAGHWAESAIRTWADHGVLNGTNGQFRPNAPITRAELAAVINRVIGYNAAGSNAFSDVSETDWFYGDVLKLNTAGVLLGSGGRARPQDNLTREEAAVVIARAFGLAGNAGGNDFPDAASVSDWAAASVGALKALGYLHGDTAGRFRPRANITRAEVVTIVDNFIAAYYAAAGEQTGSVTGNAVIRADGVTLKDATIGGDLYIAEGVGEGTVILDGVTVSGVTYVRGGGPNSVIIRGGTHLGRVVIEKSETGVLRVAVEGTAAVLESLTILESESGVVLEGPLPRLSIESGSHVTLKNAKTADIEISGSDAAVTVESGTTVDRIAISGNRVSVTGPGKVTAIAVTAGTGVTITVPNAAVTVSESAGAVTTGNGATIEPGKTGTSHPNSTTTPSGGGTSNPGGGGTTNAATPVIDPTTPADQNVAQGNPVSLTVVATVSDGGTRSYQWYRNTTNSNQGGTKIEGATADSYDTRIAPDAQVLSVTYYYVIVTNTNNGKTATATSRAAAVTVTSGSNPEPGELPAPVFALHPTGRTVFVGDPPVQLSVGMAPIDDENITQTLQWYESDELDAEGDEIEGAIGYTYNAPTSVAGETYYYVVATNTRGSESKTAISARAAVTVIEPTATITITDTTPADSEILYVGYITSAHVLSVTATLSGTGTLRYQWYKTASATPGENDTSLLGATTDTLQLSEEELTAGTYYYYVIVSDAAENARPASSRVATVVVKNPAIKITQQPLAVTAVAAGTPTSSTTLSVTAEVVPNTQPITYQWYKAVGATPDENSDTSVGERGTGLTASYVLPALTEGDHYYYVKLDSRNAATVTSSVAKVTVGAGAASAEELTNALANNDNAIIVITGNVSTTDTLAIPEGKTLVVAKDQILTNTNGLTINGELTVADGASVKTQGTLTIAEGSTLTVSDEGTLEITDTTTTSGKGTISLADDAKLDVIAEKTFTVAADTALEVGNVTLAGTASDQTGTVTVEGILTISNGKTLTVGESNKKAALEIKGTLDIPSNAVLKTDTTGTATLANIAILNIGAGGSLTIDGILDVNTATLQLANDATLAVEGALNLNESIALSTGTLSLDKGTVQVTSEKTLTVGSGAGLVVTAVEGGKAALSGAVELEAGAGFEVEEGAELTVTGTLTTSTDLTVNGTLKLSGSNTLDVKTDLTLGGKGTIDLGESGSLSFTDAPSKTLTIGEDATLKGLKTFPAGETLMVNGTLETKGTLTVDSTASLRIPGTLDVAEATTLTGNVTLQGDAAVLDLTANLTVSKSSASTLTLPASLTLKGSGTLALSSENDQASTITLPASATLTISEEATPTVKDLTFTALTVAGEGTLTIDDELTLGNDSKSLTVSGHLAAKSITVSEDASTSALTVTGSLETPALTLNGDAAIAGSLTLVTQSSDITLTIAADKTLTIDGEDAVLVIDNNVTLDGNGTLKATDGGVITLANGITLAIEESAEPTIEADLTVDDLTIDGSGSLTVTGELTVTAGHKLTIAAGVTLIVNGAITPETEEEDSESSILSPSAAPETSAIVEVATDGALIVETLVVAATESLVVNTGASLTITEALTIGSELTIDGDLIFEDQTTLTVNDTLTIDGEGESYDGAVLTVKGALTVDGSSSLVFLANSTLAVIGTLTISEDATLDLSAEHVVLKITVEDEGKSDDTSNALSTSASPDDAGTIYVDGTLLLFAGSYAMKDFFPLAVSSSDEPATAEGVIIVLSSTAKLLVVVEPVDPEGEDIVAPTAAPTSVALVGPYDEENFPSFITLATDATLTIMTSKATFTLHGSATINQNCTLLYPMTIEVGASLVGKTVELVLRIGEDASITDANEGPLDGAVSGDIFTWNGSAWIESPSEEPR